MGSYCGIYFDGLSICDAKSYVPDNFTALFQETDRVELRELPEGAEDDDEHELVVKYVASRDTILHRLSLLGATPEVVGKAFEAWITDQRDTWSEYAADGWGKNTAKALVSFTYDEWKIRAPEVLSTRYDFSKPDREAVDEIDRQMRERQDGWLWFGGYGSSISLRGLLDACTEVQSVTLDISDLVNGGWYDETGRVCEEARLRAPGDTQPLLPTMILAEGSTDIQVLRKSLNAMHPEVSDYFSFFNHSELSVDGGASYLVKFLKAFAAARAAFRMVAIFDNDTVGKQALEQARALNLPSNIIVTALPDSELAKEYPTIGPQGQHTMDVNGQAAGIELYLGRDALSRQGKLRPIRWTGYVQGAKAYQGEVECKGDVLNAFNNQMASIGGPSSAQSTFPDLKRVWQHIFGLVEKAAGVSCIREWEHRIVE